MTRKASLSNVLLAEMKLAQQGNRKRLGADAAERRMGNQLPSGDDHDDFGDIDTGAEDTIHEHISKEGVLNGATAASAEPSRKKQKKQRMQKKQEVLLAKQQAAGSDQVQ